LSSQHLGQKAERAILRTPIMFWKSELGKRGARGFET